MAKATSRIEQRQLSQAEQDAQALGEILQSVAQQKDSVIAFLDIVNEMHQAGILDVVRGVMKNRQQIGILGVHQLNKSGAQRMIKNGVTAMQFLAQLDPAQLKQVLGAVAGGLEHARPSDRPVGMWGIVNTLREPEVNASVSMVMNFLRGMGHGLPHVH